jgi:uncharacterized membrane protein (DUF485 family)
MSGLQHASAGAHGDNSPSPRSARYGLILFTVYLLLYGSFVLLNAFAPDLMEIILVAGINCAVLSGIGLIVAALVLALLYGWLCRAAVSMRDRGASP